MAQISNLVFTKQRLGHRRALVPRPSSERREGAEAAGCEGSGRPARRPAEPERAGEAEGGSCVVRWCVRVGLRGRSLWRGACGAGDGPSAIAWNGRTVLKALGGARAVRL